MFDIMGYVEQNSDVLQSQKVQAMHIPCVQHVETMRDVSSLLVIIEKEVKRMGKGTKGNKNVVKVVQLQ